MHYCIPGIVGYALAILVSLVYSFAPEEKRMDPEKENRHLGRIENFARGLLVLTLAAETDPTKASAWALYPCIIFFSAYVGGWVLFFRKDYSRRVMMLLAIVPCLYFYSLSLYVGSVSSILVTIAFALAHITHTWVKTRPDQSR